MKTIKDIFILIWMQNIPRSIKLLQRYSSAQGELSNYRYLKNLFATMEQILKIIVLQRLLSMHTNNCIQILTWQKSMENLHLQLVVVQLLLLFCLCETSTTGLHREASLLHHRQVSAKQKIVSYEINQLNPKY